MNQPELIDVVTQGQTVWDELDRHDSAAAARIAISVYNRAAVAWVKNSGSPNFSIQLKPS